ncbi:hypothetical protein F7725_025311 [Dissostichus mawsoni]|uniref:Protein phosphatase 1 regulatory subunit 36 n=1 Tax=Dissostichus mawsoni TaxID=36200 RepID=A0A7J5XBX8_DISMA|nr:hypothetical protein F7725_025311 [Dissostichus mawsoni]
MQKHSEELQHLSVQPSGRWVWRDESRTVEFVRCKALDDVLPALLLYLSCFFEHKSLEDMPKSSMAVDLITEHNMMAEAFAKKEIAQNKLAVCYFSLMMDLEMEQHEHTAYQKGRMSSNSTDWLLHACLYSFFCYAAWVTFGRKDLRDIQEEVGRLLYSDTFNMAVRNRTDGDSGTTFTAVIGSRRPALSSIVNQRSPLMMSLLPSPKERSPHLFLGNQAGGQSPLRAGPCDTKVLMEELNQQLATLSFGILGKPLRQFSRSTLTPYGEQENNKDEDYSHEPESDVSNNSEDHPGVHVGGSRSSFMEPKSTGRVRYGSTPAHTQDALQLLFRH